MTRDLAPHMANEEHLEFLDKLRMLPGQDNMYGAAPTLASHFGIDIRDARRILTYWMETYKVRHPEEV